MSAGSRIGLWWLGIFIMFIAILVALSPMLLPFVLGIIVAYLLDPVVDRLERKKLSRGVATAVVTCAFFCISIAALVGLVPLISEQLAGLIGHVPELVEHFSMLYNTLLDRVLASLPEGQVDVVQNAFGNVSMVVMEVLTDVANDAFASGKAFLNVISMLLITPIVAFYLLKEWDEIIHRCDELLPRRHADTIREQVRAIDSTLSGFMRGQMMVCMCLMGYYAVTLTLIGLPFGFLVGLLSGLLVIIPYVGWVSCFGLALTLAYAHDGGTPMLGMVAGVYLFAQAIESYYLTPKLVGDRVGLHPLWLIFGMLAGGTLLGFVGVLLAVPLTAVIGVLIRFAIRRYLKSSLYQ